MITEPCYCGDPYCDSCGDPYSEKAWDAITEALSPLETEFHIWLTENLASIYQNWLIMSGIKKENTEVG